MELINDWRLLTADEIVPMAKLIKNMLMGRDSCPLDQVRRLQYEPRVDSLTFIDEDESNGEIHNKKVFRVTGFTVGLVASIGPSTREIVAKMHAVSLWHRALLDNFPGDLGSATYESNMLLGKILNLDDTALKSMCFGHRSNVRWRPPFYQYKHIPVNNDIQSGLVQRLQARKAAIAEGEKGTTQLMQLRRLCGRQLRWKTGIASPQARPGDLVCWVSGIRHCVTLRLNIGSNPRYGGNTQMQVAGTAVLGENVAGAAVDHDGRILQSQKEGSGFETPCSWDSSLKLDIKMDARTLFLLLN